ncbi:MAG: OmpH family outer membrane protein [Proteobacteria bacterium]|nr:OmpH family outer membrane protein [Pseudomonadota bacterium]
MRKSIVFGVACGAAIALALQVASLPIAWAQQAPQRPAQQRPPAQPQQPQAQQQQPPPPQQPAAQPQATAQLPPVGTFAVIADINVLLRDATAAQAVRNQIERQRSSYQTEIQKQENDLRNADQELAKQRAILSPEAFAQKRRDLEKRVADAQQAVQNRRRILDQAFGDAMQVVTQAMVEVIGELLIERQYQIVFPKTQVVVVQNALEITPEVLRRLNRKLPTTTVTIPKE